MTIVVIGGTGLIGSKTVAIGGHDVVAPRPRAASTASPPEAQVPPRPE
jgi:hypothetical protein